MLRLGIVCFFCIVSILLSAQDFIGTVDEEGKISVRPTEPFNFLQWRNEGFTQLEGFPVGARANKTFKNFRNVSLADINNDGLDDILWGADNQFLVHNHEGLLWRKFLIGTIIYPPSIADLDNDGSLEIVQATGGSQTTGRLYVFDGQGADRSGWPKSYNGHWILLAPAIADVDDDGIKEIIFNERDSPASKLHMVKPDGTPYSENWPLSIDGTLAVTPSIGDVDGDQEKEIFTANTNGRFLINLDGSTVEGWPQITTPGQKYSFQSPLIADLNQDGGLEVIGATHGDEPEFYVLDANGQALPNWPQPVPDASWTFNTPTLVEIDNEPRLLMSRPGSSANADMLYAWDGQGDMLFGYPLIKEGGLEGLISVLDVDGDEEFELLFGSNLLGEDGRGFIHAYELDGFTEVEGFPLRPRGWTLMNGVNAGDINGDGKLDLVALSYTSNIGSPTPDSIFLNVYEMNAPYARERILWSTYKGSNTRDGLVEKRAVTSTSVLAKPLEISVFPNPARDQINVEMEVNEKGRVAIELFNSFGQKCEQLFEGEMAQGRHKLSFSIRDWPNGIYHIRLLNNKVKMKS
ncbi:MAG: FG-GAP-like repeat-containing protein, partial [Bacteroidota bacterium]